MKNAFWNIVFSLFFLGLVYCGVMWLMDAGAFPLTVTLGDFLLMMLAIFRLTRLTSYDIITQFIRDAVKDAPKGTFVGTFAELIRCPWCTGLWYSFFVVFFFFATPFAYPVVLILALAGVASVVQITANLLGWSAEFKKRVVLGTESKSTTTCG